MSNLYVNHDAVVEPSFWTPGAGMVLPQDATCIAERRPFAKKPGSDTSGAVV